MGWTPIASFAAFHVMSCSVKRVTVYSITACGLQYLDIIVQEKMITLRLQLSACNFVQFLPTLMKLAHDAVEWLLVDFVVAGDFNKFERVFRRLFPHPPFVLLYKNRCHRIPRGRAVPV
jgi:hypothetical protein